MEIKKIINEIVKSNSIIGLDIEDFNALGKNIKYFKEEFEILDDLEFNFKPSNKRKDIILFLTTKENILISSLETVFSKINSKINNANIIYGYNISNTNKIEIFYN